MFVWRFAWMVWCVERIKPQRRKSQKSVKNLSSSFTASSTTVIPLSSSLSLFCVIVSNIPEIYAGCEEIIAIMQPREYDQDLYVYYSQLCPKNDISRRMHKPQVGESFIWIIESLNHWIINRTQSKRQRRTPRLLLSWRATSFFIVIWTRLKWILSINRKSRLCSARLMIWWIFSWRWRNMPVVQATPPCIWSSRLFPSNNIFTRACGLKILPSNNFPTLPKE